MKEMMEKAGVGQTELARWLGMNDRTIRRYIAGERPIPELLETLLEYWIEKPDAMQWFRERAAQRKPVVEIEVDDESSRF